MVSRGYIDGCFDIMHSGHYNAIRQARAICDTLVVGIHSDEEIADNKALPVMRQNERYALLEHIKWVDEILYDVPYSPLVATLELANADFCIHGDDMPVNAQGFCAYDDMRNAGRLRIVKRTEGVSTTDLIGRLLTLARQQHGPTEFGLDGASTPRGSGIPVGDIRRYPAPAPTASPDPAIEALIRKYDMAPEDAAKLRASCGHMNDCSPCNGEEPPAESYRTNAPVQLLTSTRRIADFASSRQPQDGDRVVYAGGTFDMFHVGHAQFLKDAKAQGSFLLVGIYDDAAVTRSKGEHLPVMNLTERILNVCACKWVDEVIIGAPLEVTRDLINTWGIKVVAQGVGHRRNSGGERHVESNFPHELTKCVEVESKWPELCHETIVGRIMASREAFVKRNRTRAQREDVYYAGKEADSLPKEV